MSHYPLLVPLLLGALLGTTQTAIAQSFSGTLDNTDATQQGRTFRSSGNIGKCDPPNTYLGLFNAGTTFRFDTFVIPNDSCQDACVTVNFNTGSCGANVHSTAYAGSYDPTNQSANYLGDLGPSTSHPYSFVLPAFTDLVIVVNNSFGGSVNCSYSFDVSGVLAACGRMTGGGSVFQGGRRFTHGFELQCDPTQGPNNVQIDWDGNRFDLTRVLTVRCTNDPTISEGQPVAGLDTIEVMGVGRLNGVDGAMITLKFTDAGEPGKGLDLAEFTIDDGANPPIVVSGTLEKGNHQAHAPR